MYVHFSLMKRSRSLITTYSEIGTRLHIMDVMMRGFLARIIKMRLLDWKI
jgi:hypothetical protein